MRRSLVVIVMITTLIASTALMADASTSSGARAATPVPAARGPKPKIKTPPKPKPTPVEQIMAKASPTTGLLSKRDALVLFATVFGNVPGVKVPKGRQAAVDGTVAVQAVESHLDEYTPAQRRAIERLLAPPPDAVTRTIEYDANGNVVTTAAVDRQAAPSAAFTAARKRFSAKELEDGIIVDEYAARQQYRAPERLGPGSGPRKVTFTVLPTVPAEKKKKKAFAWALPHRGDPTWCELTFVAPRINSIRQTQSFLAFVVAHEAFHCFQFVIEGEGKDDPAWVDEGSAEYAASDILDNGGYQDVHWWTSYATVVNRPLFARSYDAVGFYAHLKQVGVNPYEHIPLMLLSTSNESAFQVSGADTDEFLDSWASTWFRGALPGDAWTMTGPGVQAVTAKATPVDVALPRDLDEPTPFPVQPYNNAIYDLHTAADVIRVEVEPGSHVRVSDGKTEVDRVGATVDFCTRFGGCTCLGDDVSGGSGVVPASTSDNGLVPLDASSKLAITGGPTGAFAAISTYSMPNYCCAGPTHPVNQSGLEITPKVGCQLIGFKIHRGDPLKLEIGFALLVDHPRLRMVYAKAKNGTKRFVGVHLDGINGVLLDFGAGVQFANSNDNYDIEVPFEAEVPVLPRRSGSPTSMKVKWKVIIKTALGGANSTLWARGRYALGGPLGVENGQVLQPSVTSVEKILDNVGGITIAPSGIVVAVKTEFVADTGAPKQLKDYTGALTASFGVTQGSDLGASLILCHGAHLTLAYSAEGGSNPPKKKTIFDKQQVLPEGFQSCGPVTS